MVEAVSCGGIVIHCGRILTLYKNQNGKYVGWVLPKGTHEAGESFKETALREVMEEAGVRASVLKYVGKTQYTFRGSGEYVNKTVHWYLMAAYSFDCTPQKAEFFADAGFYKRHEAFHLLKFHDERQILVKACGTYDAFDFSADAAAGTVIGYNNFK